MVQKRVRQAVSVVLPQNDYLVWRLGFAEASRIVHAQIAEDMARIKPDRHFWPLPRRRHTMVFDSLPTRIDEAHECRQETLYDPVAAVR